MARDDTLPEPLLTIVGGQPPARRKRGVAGKLVGSVQRDRPRQVVQVPVNLERVLLLAAQDPDFREDVLAHREEAITRRGLSLRPSERQTLAATPRRMLETMVGRIDPTNPRRRTFMRAVAAVAVAAAGTALVGCLPEDSPSRGVGGDDPWEGREPPVDLGRAGADAGVRPDVADLDTGPEDAGIDEGTVELDMDYGLPDLGPGPDLPEDPQEGSPDQGDDLDAGVQ